MAESGCNDLRKGGAQRAIALRNAARVILNISPVNGGKMAELVNNRTLLRTDQQQHEAQCSVHRSHEIRALCAAGAYAKANRIRRSLQYTGCTGAVKAMIGSLKCRLGRRPRPSDQRLPCPLELRIKCQGASARRGEILRDRTWTK